MTRLSKLSDLELRRLLLEILYNTKGEMYKPLETMFLDSGIPKSMCDIYIKMLVNQEATNRWMTLVEKEYAPQSR